MARTTGNRRTSAAAKPATRATARVDAPAPDTTGRASSGHYVLPLVHVTVPATLVHFGSTREQASRDHYVTPVAHVKVPANWVDYGIWAALGVAVAGEGVTLPIAGALGVGAMLRRRSRPPRK
jgi:hypothetical protein